MFNLTPAQKRAFRKVPGKKKKDGREPRTQLVETRVPSVPTKEDQGRPKGPWRIASKSSTPGDRDNGLHSLIEHAKEDGSEGNWLVLFGFMREREHDLRLEVVHHFMKCYPHMNNGIMDWALGVAKRLRGNAAKSPSVQDAVIQALGKITSAVMAAEESVGASRPETVPPSQVRGHELEKTSQVPLRTAPTVKFERSKPPAIRAERQPLKKPRVDDGTALAQRNLAAMRRQSVSDQKDGQGGRSVRTKRRRDDDLREVVKSHNINSGFRLCSMPFMQNGLSNAEHARRAAALAAAKRGDK